MIRLGLLLAVFATGLTASDHLRRGNTAARATANDALLHYELAESSSTDPGLIAFNRALFLMSQGDFREAELQFLCCLDDREIPIDRQRKALNNRGVCLIRRGEDAQLLRTAIRCFEQCLALSHEHDELTKTAEYNLELAKILWNRERARSKEQSNPSDTDSEPHSRPMSTPGTTEPGEGSTPTAETSASTGSAEPKSTPSTTIATNTSPQPGAGTLPVPKDESVVQVLSPADTYALLDRTGLRLKQARGQNEKLRAGPERPNVRDW